VIWPTKDIETELRKKKKEERVCRLLHVLTKVQR